MFEFRENPAELTQMSYDRQEWCCILLILHGFMLFRVDSLELLVIGLFGDMSAVCDLPAGLLWDHIHVGEGHHCNKAPRSWLELIGQCRMLALAQVAINHLRNIRPLTAIRSYWLLLCIWEYVRMQDVRLLINAVLLFVLPLSPSS